MDLQHRKSHNPPLLWIHTNADSILYVSGILGSWHNRTVKQIFAFWHTLKQPPTYVGKYKMCQAWLCIALIQASKDSPEMTFLQGKDDGLINSKTEHVTLVKVLN